MKLSPEQFDALVEYINAKALPDNHFGVYVDRVITAYSELERQLKGDRDEEHP